MQTKKVILGSTSEHKLIAVNDAFKYAFPDNKVEVVSIKTESSINEQPFGHEETLLGALNRLNDIKKNYKEDFDFIVGIENGIFEVNNEYYDIGWVVIEDNKGKVSKAVSTGVKFYNKYVEEAKNIGFDKITISSIIAKHTNTISTDPHKYLTGNLITRSEILSQALVVAIGNYFLNLKS